MAEFADVLATFIPDTPIDDAGTVQARYATVRSSLPSPLGSWGSPITAFDGDLSTTITHQHTISGAATLGQPTSGYQQNYESSAQILGVYNTSGYNHSAAGNGGRTGAAGKVIHLDQYGQGDLSGIFIAGVVASTKSGATSYLASPEIGGIAGDLYGGADGVYIEWLGDMNTSDLGHDIAVVGAAWNFNRSNAAEAIGANWVGAYMAATDKPIDAFFRLRGPAAAGLDLSGADFSYYRLAAFNIVSAGTGYVVGDIITVSGGTSLTPTKFRVSIIDGSGGVTAVTIANTGLYSVAPLGPTTYNNFTSTGGTGSGAVFAGQHANGAAMVLPPTGGRIYVSTDSGDIIANRRGITGVFSMGLAGLSYGSVGSLINSSPTGANNVQFGSQHTSLGSRNTQLGQGTYDYAQNGVLLFSSGTFSGFTGSSQNTKRIFRNSGTAAMRLTGDGTTANSQNTYLCQAISAHNLTIRVNAVDMSNGDSATWTAKFGALTRASSGNCAYAGALTSATTPDLSTGAGSTATVIVSADTTLQGLNVTFTPPSGGHTWRAQAVIITDQVQ